MRFDLWRCFLYLPDACFHPRAILRWGVATPSGQWCFEVSRESFGGGLLWEAHGIVSPSARQNVWPRIFDLLIFIHSLWLDNHRHLQHTWTQFANDNQASWSRPSTEPEFCTMGVNGWDTESGCCVGIVPSIHTHSPSFTHVRKKRTICLSINMFHYLPSTSSRDGIKCSRRRIDENRPEMFQSLKLQSKWWNWNGALLQGCVWQLQGEISTVPFMGEVLQHKKYWYMIFWLSFFWWSG